MPMCLMVHEFLDSWMQVLSDSDNYVPPVHYLKLYRLYFLSQNLCTRLHCPAIMLLCHFFCMCHCVIVYVSQCCEIFFENYFDESCCNFKTFVRYPFALVMKYVTSTD